MTWFEHIYPLGEALLYQTPIVMGFGLLVVLVAARDAYSRRGWLLRLLGMLAIYGLLGSLDLWMARGTGGPDDIHGVGVPLHYLLLWVVLAFTLGAGIATLRARRRAERAPVTDGAPPAGPPVG